MFFAILKLAKKVSSIFVNDLTGTLEFKIFEISFVDSFGVQNDEGSLTLDLIVYEMTSEFVAFFVD